MNKYDPNKSKKEPVNEQRYLQFSLGKECYALHLLTVKEVVTVPPCTPLPNSPAYYNGIMNLRGQIISIIDLRKKLNIKTQVTENEEAVIIAEIQGIGIGLIVDSINKVLNIKTNEVSEVPEVSSQVNAQYIQGVYQVDNRLTILLDLESILNIKEIKTLSQKAA